MFSSSMSLARHHPENAAGWQYTNNDFEMQHSKEQFTLLKSLAIIPTQKIQEQILRACKQ